MEVLELELEADDATLDTGATEDDAEEDDGVEDDEDRDVLETLEVTEDKLEVAEESKEVRLNSVVLELMESEETLKLDEFKVLIVPDDEPTEIEVVLK